MPDTMVKEVESWRPIIPKESGSLHNGGIIGTQNQISH
jgi:hypothetical protein